jgi:hypothetical protein
MKGQAIDDVAVLAFKRPRELNALLHAIDSYGTKKVTIFQDYDSCLSAEWQECSEIIKGFCSSSSTRKYIISDLSLGPHDAMHKLLEACKLRSYEYFTFFEEDVIPSRSLLDTIGAFQSVPEKQLLNNRISSISGNNGCLNLSSRDSSFTDYLRYTLPPTKKLREIGETKLSKSELRTLSLHSLRPWVIYDYQFTLMLVESDTYQLVPTAKWLSHVGHGHNSTHFKSANVIDIECEASKLANIRPRKDPRQLADELEHCADDRELPQSKESFWGYRKLNYMCRILCVYISGLLEAWVEL